MKLAMIGLGNMDMKMATRPVRGGHRVIGYARSDVTVLASIKNGAEDVNSLEETIGKLKAPRFIRGYTARLLSAICNEFGGHGVKKTD